MSNETAGQLMHAHVTSKPLVSVVIATRNRPEMLRAALEAVAEQTYAGHIECLIVFDQAEPDFSLADDRAGRTVQVLQNDQRTPGLAGARNTGILAATGDFVAFCDDDDVWSHSKIERQIDTIGNSLTSATGIIIDYVGSRSERIPNAADFTLENLVRNRVMEAHPSTVLMRRDALIDRIGLVDEDIPGSYAEDFDFIIRAAQAGPITVVEEPLVTVRWGQSMFSRNWATIVAAVDYLIAKHDVFRHDRRALARLLGRRAFANAAMKQFAEAWRDIGRTLRSNPIEKRAYVSMLVASRLVSAERLLDMAHRRGRGI